MDGMPVTLAAGHLVGRRRRVYASGKGRSSERCHGDVVLSLPFGVCCLPEGVEGSHEGGLHGCERGADGSRLGARRSDGAVWIRNRETKLTGDLDEALVIVVVIMWDPH